MALKKDVQADAGILSAAWDAFSAPFRSAASAVRTFSSAARTAVSAADRCGMQAVLSAKPLVRLYLFFAIAGTAALGAQLVEARLSKTADYSLDVRCLEIQERPLWLDDEWVSSIPAPFAGRPTVNIFEDDVVKKIHDSFKECPWIEKICYVRKEFPNRLSVKIKVRAPAIAVWERDSYALVDREGVVLPKRFRTVPDFGFNVLVAEGISSSAPAPGRRWEDPGIEAAASMAMLIRDGGEPILNRIARADVSAASRPTRGRSEIILFAREGGGRIEWGSAPSKNSPLEIPVAKKVENLKKLFAAFPDMREVEYALVHFKNVYIMPVSRAAAAKN